jgi:two-component system response regulator FlrC
MNTPVVELAENELIAEDPRSQALVELAERVAASDVAVMISGESGTGKEVLARLIHRRSGRAAGPFVAINCAAIPENMLEAVLFGYEKGAYTGAHQSRSGKFEQAQEGTLLLDEISEMDLSLQAKLLRVIQESEVERLGGQATIRLDVRVLATSNRNLREEVANGRFREDLFYRLNVFPMHLPALRDRPGDILPLAHYLMKRSVRNGPCPVLSVTAERSLLAYSWPGNVRELDNVIQRALILKTGHVIEASDISLESVDTRQWPIQGQNLSMTMPSSGAASALEDGLRLRERELIIAALRAGGGSRKAAAAHLGISQRTLRYKLSRLRDAGIGIPRTVGMESA